MEFLPLACLRKLGQPGHHQGGQQYVHFPCTSCCIGIPDTFFRNDADPVRPLLCACTIASTVPYNEKRDSVKLLSQNWYKAGTVFIMDAVQYVPIFPSSPFVIAVLHLHVSSRESYRWADHELLFCLCCSIFASAITPDCFVCLWLYLWFRQYSVPVGCSVWPGKPFLPSSYPAQLEIMLKKLTLCWLRTG